LQSVTLKPTAVRSGASPPVKLFTQPRMARTNWAFSADAQLEKFLLVLPREQAAGGPRADGADHRHAEHRAKHQAVAGAIVSSPQNVPLAGLDRLEQLARAS
jgi:hypothetical protein